MPLGSPRASSPGLSCLREKSCSRVPFSLFKCQALWGKKKEVESTKGQGRTVFLSCWTPLLLLSLNSSCQSAPPSSLPLTQKLFPVLRRGAQLCLSSVAPLIHCSSFFLASSNQSEGISPGQGRILYKGCSFSVTGRLAPAATKIILLSINS